MAVDARRVSVVVPVRDGDRYIAEALDSILGQSTPPGEVVVVDDGSTDDTPRLLRAYGARLRVVRQDPAGVAAAINRGVATATGELLAFLDADDVFPPASIECRIIRLTAADAPDAVFGRMVQFVSPELGPEARLRFRHTADAERVKLLQTMVIRRAAFCRVGELDTSYVTASNIDWIARAEASGLRFAEVDDVVHRRRLHGKNLGVTERGRKHVDLVSVVRAHRRRGSQGRGSQGEQ